MANWCSGDLKIRGHIDDVYKLLDHLIYRGGCVVRNENEITLKEVSGHLNDTFRCFIEGNYTQDFYANDNEEIIVILPTQHAWSPILKRFQALSKKFQVDFKFYGYERGMEFNYEFEILKGEITLERKIRFTDYQWECPHPMMGG